MHNAKVAGVQVLWNPCKKQFSCSQSPLRRPAISPTLMPAWCVYKGEKNRTHCFSSVIKEYKCEKSKQPAPIQYKFEKTPDFFK